MPAPLGVTATRVIPVRQQPEPQTSQSNFPVQAQTVTQGPTAGNPFTTALNFWSETLGISPTWIVVGLLVGGYFVYTRFLKRPIHKVLYKKRSFRRRGYGRGRGSAPRRQRALLAREARYKGVEPEDEREYVRQAIARGEKVRARR